MIGKWTNLHRENQSAAKILSFAGCLCLQPPLLQHQKCSLQRLRKQSATQHAAVAAMIKLYRHDSSLSRRTSVPLASSYILHFVLYTQPCILLHAMLPYVSTNLRNHQALFLSAFSCQNSQYCVNMHKLGKSKNAKGIRRAG